MPYQLVLRVYSYFSGESKQTAELKEFFDFVGSDYASALRHVPTRWVTLGSALERCLCNHDALKAYFQSTENCPSFLKQFYYYEDDDVISYCILQLYFMHHILDVFQISILKLQANSLTICELYIIFSQEWMINSLVPWLGKE